MKKLAIAIEEFADLLKEIKEAKAKGMFKIFAVFKIMVIWRKVKRLSKLADKIVHMIKTAKEVPVDSLLTQPEEEIIHIAVAIKENSTIKLSQEKLYHMLSTIWHGVKAATM